MSVSPRPDHPLAYDAEREAYETGTWWVAFALGFTGLMVLIGSPLLFEQISREEMSVSRLAGLGAASLAASVVSTLVPGAWRLLGIAAATVPLLVVVQALAQTA